MSRDTRLRRADFAAGRVTRRLHGTLFSLSVSPLSRDRTSSFACVVSKKVVGKAVRRNLLKRRCREAARERMRTLPTLTPVALVFRAKKAAANAVFADVARDIYALVDKISSTSYNVPQ